METKIVGELIEDFDLYPRIKVDGVRVTEFMDAMEAGVEFPAIIITTDGVIIDGYHRKRATERLHGQEAEISCEVRGYENRQQMYLDCLRENAPHGKPLYGYEKVNAIRKALELEIDEGMIANALNMTPATVASIKDLKIVKVRSSDVHVCVKQSVRHLGGKVVTKKQAEGMASMPGTGQANMIEQVYKLIDCDLVDESNQQVVAGLGRLYSRLRKFFERADVA